VAIRNLTVWLFPVESRTSIRGEGGKHHASPTQPAIMQDGSLGNCLESSINQVVKAEASSQGVAFDNGLRGKDDLKIDIDVAGQYLHE
jgi:hypothetical protein